MIKAIQIPTDMAAGDKSSPARQIPAVALCCDAWEAAFLASYSQDRNEIRARSCANRAYRNALPPLANYESICDFIACVAHGIVIQAIDDDIGSKLLYASQIAVGALRNAPKAKPIPAT
jgi:hypothetical protein